MLSTLAHLPEVKNLDATACDRLFRELNAKYPVYSSISAATPAGAVFASSGPPDPAAADLSGRKSFREALRTLDFSAGDYAETKSGKAPSICFSYPVLDADKKPLAVMHAALKFEGCVQLLKQSGLPEGYSCDITDDSGIRLFSFPENAARAPGVAVSREAFDVMSAGPGPAKTGKTSLKGFDRVAAFERLRLRDAPSPYLYLIVGNVDGRTLHAADMEMLGCLCGLGVLAVFALAFVRKAAGCGEYMGGDAGVQKSPGGRKAAGEARVAELAGANELLRLEVAESVKAEETLRAVLILAEDEKSKSESIIASITEGLTIIDRDFKVVYQNEISKTFVGNCVDKYCYRAAHNRDSVCEQCPVLKCFEDGKMHKSERGKLFNGEMIYFEIAASPLRNATGEVSGAIELARDITQRKLAEEKLMSSEERLKIIFESAPDPYYLTDLEGRIVDGNKAALKITGYAKKDLVGKNLLELGLLQPEQVRKAVEVLARTAAGHPSGPDEFTLKRKDGTTVFIESRSFPTVIRGQRLLLGIARDITKRKTAEESFLESQQRLSDIIDFLPDATFVIDRAGKIIAWNRAMEEMTGLSAEAMLGKGGHEYALPFHGERRPMLIDLVLDHDEEVEAKYVTLHRKGGLLAAQTFSPSLRGHAAYLFGTASALYDSRGNIVGAIESIRDVTGHKIMEEAVARAEEKYRDIFENSITGIYQVTPEGRFMSLNMSIANLLGYRSPEELINEVSTAWDLYVHPERRSELHRRLEEHRSVHDFEAELFRKDRSVVWVALNVSAVRNSAGQIVHIEGTASDITDKKLLRAQLDQAQKMEAIGTLAGGIAHDFNNILTPIIGYTELSLNMVSEDGRLSHNMRQVLLSANRAKDLVRQILTFSRKTDQERKPVRVGLIIKEALKLLRSSLPSTIDIRQSLHADAVESTAMADPTQIHQVLMNLCTNAAYAMRAKGGTLTVILENVEAGPRAGKGGPDIEPGPYLRLSVADTGHGMDDEVKQRIFDPYFTTKGPNEGTGLGLAVVYGIVKNLYGAIAVSSAPREGAVFDVYLPRTRTIPAREASPSVPLPTGQGTILVVDDEKFIVDMVKEMLETLGYVTVPRYSSSDALETFETRPESFDLVITDMTMPHMTGIDLAKKIFAIRPHTPLILCTGFSETMDENRMKPLGIKKLLMKPVSMRDLADAVSNILVRGRPDTLVH
jgi:PAS domain S-box-containing protein